MRRIVFATVLAAALIVPASAGAHVTLQPSSAAAGAFIRLDVRVPNERDDAATTKLDLQLPEGFASASYEPMPGWTVKVTKSKLKTPVQTDDGPITEGVSRITWTGDGKQGSIPPGAFQDFGLSVMIPGKAGDKLTFKALQTYTGGQVVRWIGSESSNNPAPVVTVTAAGAAATANPAAATPAPTPAAAATTDSGGNGLSILALIIGVLGLAVAATALFTARRTKVAA
jgi:uncharacterized protein YcnI